MHIPVVATYLPVCGQLMCMVCFNNGQVFDSCIVNVNMAGLPGESIASLPTTILS